MKYVDERKAKEIAFITFWKNVWVVFSTLLLVILLFNGAEHIDQIPDEGWRIFIGMIYYAAIMFGWGYLLHKTYDD